ncbi:response regulator transcription factor [Aeribacillus sp. FSL K6-2848]|uniref:response regulator transcription factor n=1 Tax=Aeribacillus sp. FSL K6-2848 TaxID=2954612 RepID=UPI0030F4BEC9
MNRIQVITIDKLSLSGYGLKYILEEELDACEVNILTNDKEIIGKIKSFNPNIIIIVAERNVDLEIVAKITEDIRKADIHSRIVVMCEEIQSIFFQKLLVNQVSGLFSVRTEPLDIVNMLKMIEAGQVIFSEDITLNLLNQKDNKDFSETEIKIIKLIADEKTNKEIAQALNYSISTVEHYITNIFSKFAVKGRVGVIREAKKLNLI